MAYFKRTTISDKSSIPCPDCAAGRMHVARSCHEVWYECQQCGSRHEVSELIDQLDDEFDEDVAFVPMDRM